MDGYCGVLLFCCSGSSVPLLQPIRRLNFLKLTILVSTIQQSLAAVMHYTIARGTMRYLLFSLCSYWSCHISDIHSIGPSGMFYCPQNILWRLVSGRLGMRLHKCRPMSFAKVGMIHEKVRICYFGIVECFLSMYLAEACTILDRYKPT